MTELKDITDAVKDLTALTVASRKFAPVAVKTFAKLRATFKTRGSKAADDTKQLQEIVTGIIRLMTTSSDNHRKLAVATAAAFETVTRGILFSLENITALKNVAIKTGTFSNVVTERLNQLTTLALQHQRMIKALEASTKKHPRSPAPKKKTKSSRKRR